MDKPEDNGSTQPDRLAFLAERRALGPRRMDTLFATGYDEHWGDISALHASFVQDLLDRTPGGALILDAACGTGKYVPHVRRSGRRVAAIDRSACMLIQLERKFPGTEARQLALEDLAREPAGQYDGLLCVDAMENVPPEDWPVILAGFAHVLRGQSPLYLTVEIPEPGDETLAASPGRRWSKASCSGPMTTAAATTTTPAASGQRTG